MVLHHVIGKENALEPAVHHQDKQAKQAQAIVKISKLKQAQALEPAVHHQAIVSSRRHA